MQVTRFPSRAEGLSDRMSGFVSHLRMNGLSLGPSETAEALNALSFVAAEDVQQARMAMRAVYVPDAEGWRKFDELFDAYWFNAGRQKAGAQSAHVRVQAAKPTLWQPHLNEEQDDGAGDDEAEARPSGGEGESEGVDGRLIATRTDNLTRRDLRELLTDEDLRRAEEAARRVARAIRDRRSRRRKAARRGDQLDMRRIRRASLARGGEPMDLFRRAKPDRPMRIVALCDVSGSMTVYARVFLSFLKGLLDVDTTADAYLFHTRLMRITEALRDKDSLRAAGRLSLMAEGFGGGTDIGGALATFASEYGARALNGRTIVIVMSDGYCTGSPDALEAALSRISQKARRIVWLNPLLGWRDYQPVARAIGQASPYLDAHLPANTIEALSALEQEFERL